ncbi:MAG: ABC transporter permease [Eubacterium sp.]|nr:ABC transporter permease [Eubacterium sp.]
MKLYALAWQNVKSNLKNYMSLVLSMAFSIMIFYNFQNLVGSKLFVSFGEHNEDYSNMLIRMLSVVLGVFMVFFIGYAANVFLTRRKKEIGIYIFMGLTNQRIGRLYMMEMMMAGAVTFAAGIGFGVLTTQLFQMVLLAISDLAMDIGFTFSIKSIFITSAFYFIVYTVFVLKGYLNIVKSSVLELVSASRQNESVRQPRFVLACKTVFGTAVLSAGYALAVLESRESVLEHVVLAVVLVIIGVYFLFGGMIPAIFQGLAKKKLFLYRRERNLWVNQMIFRMKKNYRTYAIVCVMMICSVTALAASFALRQRYENMVHFRSTYTYQLLSSRQDLEETAKELIEQENEIAYSTKIPILCLEPEQEGMQPVALIAWSGFRQLAQEAGLRMDLKEPEDGEVVGVSHLYLVSLITQREDVPVQIMGRTFLMASETQEPYLGYLQEQMSFYLANDHDYDSLRPSGEELYAYNYKIKDPSHYQASVGALGALVSNTKENYTARIVTGPDGGGDREWIKILYSLCVFLVMVFISASGSILFMKLYNDALEEKGRFDVLQKLGCPYKALKRAVARQLFMSYALPLLVMGISSYFSVHALEKVMNMSLAAIRLASVGLIAVFFYLCYRLSVEIYLKNAGIQKI